jgi:poly(3-hydroxybutyrate) depolymerase
LSAAEKQVTTTVDSSIPGADPSSHELTRKTPAELNLVSIASNSAVPGAPDDVKEQIKVDGKGRTFELHVPKNYDGHSPLPVVYMMHGLTENMDMMREYSNMDKLSYEKGFAVAYLQALPQNFPGLPFYHENSWNLDHGTLTSKDPSYNDLDYFKAVKAGVAQQIPVDPHREYIAGFSEGGQAAQYIAHEMPGTIAGIASVHGTILDSDPRPNTNDPTAEISVLGNDDNLLPLTGGHGWFTEKALLKGWVLFTASKVSQSEPLAQSPAWAKADGDTTEQHLSKPGEEDTIYSGGTAPVEQIIRMRHKESDGIKRGGEHAWDGGKGGWNESHPDLLTWISRPERQPDPEFDTSEQIMDFLLNYRKP